MAPLSGDGVVEHEVAAHPAHQRARHVEPEAAAVAARTAGDAALEASEQPGSIAFLEAAAIVGDRDPQRSVRSGRRRSRRRPCPRRTSRRCRGGPTGPGRAGRRRRRQASQARRRGARSGRSATRQRVPGALHARPDREDVGGRSRRLRLEAADEQQLLDHPRQPVGLVRDDRQSRVLVGRGEGVGVRADRGQRRLQVVADARAGSRP